MTHRGQADAEARVAIRVDATPAIGVGHLVRQVALAEELAARGVDVAFFGTCAVPFARELMDAHGWPLRPAGDDPDAFAADVAASGFTHAVLDGYALGPAWGRALRARGLRVGALCDGAFGADQDADVYVDQNLGAQRPSAVAAERAFLGGLDYALLRDVVRARRGSPVGSGGERTRVLVVFGGTDPGGGAPVYAELLLGLGLPVDVVAVASASERVAALEALAVAEDQALEIVPPASDLPALALGCDAVVTAAGSSVWELACLGVPMGLVCVVDNQRLGYEQASGALAVGAGVLDEVRRWGEEREVARVSLRALVTDAGLRAELARRASGLVDGRGRERVADALLTEAPGS